MTLATSGHARTLILGVINITPDSFSDGGKYLDPQAALTQIDQLLKDGADGIDLGAESTRPGSMPVDQEEEWRRLAPVLEQWKSSPRKALLSIDTCKPEIMRRCLDYPVDVINDVSGWADRRTLEAIAAKGCTYLSMHRHGHSVDMQVQPLDGQLALEQVSAFYEAAYRSLREAGFSEERIWLDPGIGFGKTDRANLGLLRQALQSVAQYHIVLGISRKSFLGRLLDIPEPSDRDSASKMLELSFLWAGVRAIRTHDVKRLSKIRDLL